MALKTVYGIHLGETWEAARLTFQNYVWKYVWNYVFDYLRELTIILSLYALNYSAIQIYTQV